MARRLALALVLPALLSAFSPGCTRRSDDAEVAVEKTLIEPFTPPPLAEVDAKADWVDMPVLDMIDVATEREKKAPPTITAEEALKLRNTSDENNEKILQGIGSQPPNDNTWNQDATLTRHMSRDVKTMNPILASTVEEFDVHALTTFNLASFDGNLKPFASKLHVVSWQSSKDRTYDKVVMRDDLVWSDGKPITAHDVVFSWRTIMNPDVPVPAQRQGAVQIRWIEAYDDHTLVFFYKQASPENVWRINFGILPKHIYENSVKDDLTLQKSDYHVKYEDDPVVGGPYKIVNRVRNQELVLERREDYYMFNGKQVRDKPRFKTVRFRIFDDLNVALLGLKKGDIEEMVLTPEQWQSQTGDDEYYARNTKARGVEWTYFFFGWNSKEPYFGDVRVRKAMSYAFDHDELLNKLCYGLYEPATGPFHPTSPMYPKSKLEPYKQDPKKAVALLTEAGWIDHDGDGVRDKEIDGRKVKFEFTIICSQDPLRVRICSLLKQNLQQLGIICHVQPMEGTSLQENVLKKKYQAVYMGYGTGADPSTSENLWKTDEMRNCTSYSNPEVDRLYAAAKKEFDREKQMAMFAQIHEHIFEDQPLTFLYFRSSFYGFTKQLRGFVMSPRGPYHYSPGFDGLWKPAAVSAY